MKGNVFSKWLKEFCALVFVQTAQAFILAIIMTLIVVLVTDTKYESQDANQITGVFAMIALASISKIEMLIKKIFGIGSDVTDPFMSGGKGFIGGIMSLKAIQTVGNNAKKIGSGMKSRRQARVNEKKAKIDYNKTRKSIIENNAQTNNQNVSATPTSVINSSMSQDSANNSNVANNTNRNLNGGTINITNSNVNMQGDKSGNKNSAQDELKKAKQDYQAKLNEIQKSKKDANKQLVSGILETGAAVVGGAAGIGVGAVYGAASGGNVLSSASNAGLYGAAMADKAAKLSVDATYGIKEMGQNGLEMHKLNREIKKTTKELEDAMKKFNAGDI